MCRDDTFRKVVLLGPAACSSIDGSGFGAIDDPVQRDQEAGLGHDSAPAVGVHYNVPVSKFEAWESFYVQPYEHPTSNAEVVPSSKHGLNNCVFVGAKRTADSVFTLGAYASVSDVSTITAQNDPRVSRGVWWYNTPGSSFGFSATQTIQQNSADTGSSEAQSRLSWHIGQDFGGYRAGEAMGLNDDSDWYKYMLVAPTSCDDLPEALALPDGVQLDVVDDFEAKGWSVVMDETYATGTTNADVQFAERGFSGKCLVVGAKTHAGSNQLVLAAFASAEFVSTITPVNEPHESEYGVWWYNTPSTSFGFSPTSTVSQSSADTSSADSGYRLSWHIRASPGAGGYRAGATTNLNSNTDYRKVVYAAPVACSRVFRDHTFSGAGDQDDGVVNASPLPFGVFHLLQDTFGEGWTTVLNVTYAHHTSNTDTDLSAFGSRCAFVGAKTSRHAATFVLGAFGAADFVSGVTTHNVPHETRGVLWYRTLSKSFGFVSSGNTVQQNSADTGSADGEDRLSWHIGQGVGGYRAGDNTGLNSDTVYRKIILVADVPCSHVQQDLSLAGGAVDNGGSMELDPRIQVGQHVHTLVPVAALSHWSVIMDDPYSHKTSDASTAFTNHNDKCLFVGCKSSSFASVFRTGAFGDGDDIRQLTTKNGPQYVRGVYWYRTLSTSFGFSPSSSISQSSADVLDQHSDERLSWHIGGSSGGWRCGSQTELNSNANYRKVVLAAPVPCSHVNNQFTWGGLSVVATLSSTQVASGGSTGADLIVITATFSTSVVNVTLADFNHGKPMPTVAGHSWALSSAVSDGNNEIRATLTVTVATASVVTYRLGFVEGTGSVTPALSASNNFTFSYTSPTVTFRSEDGAAVTHQPHVRILADFSSAVSKPPLALWNVVHTLASGVLPPGTDVEPAGALSGLHLSTSWALVIRLPVTYDTFSVSSANFTVSMGAHVTSPINLASNSSFTLRFVPPAWTFSTPASGTWPNHLLPWHLNFSAPMSRVALDWFVLPDLGAMSATPLLSPVGESPARSWQLTLRIESGLAAAAVGVKPAIAPPAQSLTVVNYRPPTVVLTSPSAGQTVNGFVHVFVASFSQRVSGFAESDVLVNASDLRYTLSTTPGPNGGCVSPGCPPEQGAVVWTITLSIVGNFESTRITVSIPEASGSIHYRNAASNAVWTDFKLVGAQIRAPAGVIAEPRMDFTVEFDSHVTGLSTDDFEVQAGGMQHSITIIPLGNASRRLGEPVAPLRALASAEYSGRLFSVRLEFDSFEPVPISLSLKGNAVDPPNEAFPARTLAGESKEPEAVADYSPPIASVDPVSDPHVGVRGAASLNPWPVTPTEFQLVVDFGTPISGLASNNFQISCGGAVDIDLDVYSLGAQPSAQWVLRVTVGPNQDSCYLEMQAFHVAGQDYPPIASTGAVFYTVNYAKEETEGDSSSVVTAAIVSCAVVAAVGCVGYVYLRHRRLQVERLRAVSAANMQVVEPGRRSSGVSQVGGTTIAAAAAAGAATTMNAGASVAPASNAIGSGAGAYVGAGAVGEASNGKLGLPYQPPPQQTFPGYPNAAMHPAQPAAGWTPHGTLPPMPVAASTPPAVADPYAAIDSYAGLPAICVPICVPSACGWACSRRHHVRCASRVLCSCRSVRFFVSLLLQHV